LVFGLFLFLLSLVNSDLVAVQLVSRHGTRAPDKIVEKLCYNERANLQRYRDMNITLSGMTGRGMQQLYDLGIYTYERYTKTGFLSHNYLQSEIYNRAVGSERTLQSAVVWANALYPKSSRPVNYLAPQPAPVPVFTLPDTEDNLIEVRKAACAVRQFRDVRQWDRQRGEKYWASTDIVEVLSEICGNDIRKAVGDVNAPYNLGDAIKDLTDAIIFDDIERFPPLPNCTFDRLAKYSKFANDQLLDRLYGNEEQIVYMNGALPATLLENFEMRRHGNHALKMWAFHGHREMSYALGLFFGIDFTFLSRRGIPKTAIPAATSVFFELHNVTNNFHVETWVWAPCLKDAETGDEYHMLKHDDKENCPATLITLKNCATQCPFEDFKNLIEGRIAKTGHYTKLCEISAHPPLSAFATSQSAFRNMSTPLLFSVIFTLVWVVMGVLACRTYLQKRRQQREYHSIPDGNRW